MKLMTRLKKSVNKALGVKADKNKTSKKEIAKNKEATKKIQKTKPAVKKSTAKKVVTKHAKKPIAKTINKPLKTSASTNKNKKVVNKKIAPTKIATKNIKTTKPVVKPVTVDKISSKAPKNRDIEFAAQFQQPVIVEKKIPKYPTLQGADSERIKILLPILKEMVKKGLIHDWIVNFTYVKGSNIYMHGYETEDEIISLREDMLVTIYEQFPDKSIGDARIPIITTDPVVMKQQLLEAKTTCSSSRKPFFELPEPKEGIELPKGYDEKLLHELFSSDNKTPKLLSQQIKSLMQTTTEVKLNACEVHATAGTIRVINSKGVDLSFHKTSILLEAVLSCKAEKVEREYYFSRSAVSPEQLDIQSILQLKIKIAKDATIAQHNTGFTGDVILSGHAVMEFFSPHHDVNPLVLHTSARLKYMGLSSFELGKSIGQLTGGEPITISTYPSLPMGLATMPIDDEGTHLLPVDLIRNGVFVQHLATQSYAQYLGVPATGSLTNVYVHPGATREEHLRGSNYFEIVSFSWFNPNPLSGDFSAEIRLAYRWINGKKTAVRGGTFIGNVFKNILSVRLSKEITQAGTYYGPRTILFKNAVVTKFE